MKRFVIEPSREPSRGSLLVILAIVIPVLLGALGLIVDNVQMFKAKRSLQSAADAAVVAAAHELRKQNLDGFVVAAEEDARMNGANEESGAVVHVNYPPKAGRWAGNRDYVEVLVEREVPTLFMRALGKSSVQVEARAVAGLVDRNIGVYALDPGDPRTLSVAKDGHVEVPDCDVFVNSRNGSAAVTEGSGSLSAGRVEIVGDYDGNGFFPDPEVGASQIADPLEDLPAPAYSDCDFVDTVTVRGNRRLRPGVYCGGIDVVDDGQATFASGVYVLRGGGLRVGKQCEPQEQPVAEHGDSDHVDSDHADSAHADSDGSASADHGDSASAGSDHSDSAHADGDSVGKCSNLCETSDHGDSEHADSDHSGSDGSASADHGDSGHNDHGDSGGESKPSARTCHPAIRGTGVTFYLTDGPDCGYGPVDIDPSASVDLTAPTSGALAGVLFFQDRDIRSGRGSVLAVSGTDQMTGVAYFPTTKVDLIGGKTGSSQEMKIVADKVGFGGRLAIECPANNGPFTPPALKRVALSE